MNEAVRAQAALVRLLKKNGSNTDIFLDDYPQMRGFVASDFSFENIRIAAQTGIEMELDYYITRWDEGKLMTIQLLKELK